MSLLAVAPKSSLEHTLALEAMSFIIQPLRVAMVTTTGTLNLLPADFVRMSLGFGAEGMSTALVGPNARG